MADLQIALKANNPDAVWNLLDADSQADADRKAKTARDAHGKADDAGKKDLEKQLGLDAAGIAALSGRTYLKTTFFQGEYEELAESKIDKVTAKGNEATVDYTEPDGDKKKLKLVKADGKWKVFLPMPDAVKP